MDAAGVPADCAEVIGKLLPKLSGIIADAQARRANRLAAINQLKKSSAKQFFHLGTALVTTTYLPEGPMVQKVMAAQAGDLLDVLQRADGWTFCRHQASERMGWIPAECVTEVATFISNQESSGSDGLLRGEVGEKVQVLSWHYSGWVLCREWNAGGTTPSRLKSGWVSDSCLADSASQDPEAKMSRWHVSVFEELDRIVSNGRAAEALLSGMTLSPWAGDKSDASLRHCVEVCSGLAAEHRQVCEAESRRDELPTWILPGAPCRWWSTTGNCFVDAYIDSVDWAGKEVRFVFAANASAWKRLPFKHFRRPPEEWRAQPAQKHDEPTPVSSCPTTPPNVLSPVAANTTQPEFPAFPADQPRTPNELGGGDPALAVASTTQPELLATPADQPHTPNVLGGGDATPTQEGFPAISADQSHRLVASARRLVEPRCWDSEAGEEPPDVAALASAWPEVAAELDLLSASQVPAGQGGGGAWPQAQERLRARQLAAQKEVLRRSLEESPAGLAEAVFLPGAEMRSSGRGASDSAGELDAEWVALQHSSAEDAQWGPVESACSPAASGLRDMLVALEGRVRQVAQTSLDVDPEQEQSPGGRDQERGAEEHARQLKQQASAAVEAVGGVLLRRWRRHLAEDKAWSLRRLGQLEERWSRTRRVRSSSFGWSAGSTRPRCGGASRRSSGVSMRSRRCSCGRRPRSTRREAPEGPGRDRDPRGEAEDLRRLPPQDDAPEAGAGGASPCPKLKQKHSVLLYSLRVLESQLKKEVPAFEQNALEGAAEESEEQWHGFGLRAEQRQALQQADADFEEALAVELAAFEVANRRQLESSESLVRQLATRLRGEIIVEHGSTLIVTRVASWELAWQALQVEFIPRLLEPFAWAAAKLAEGARAAGSGGAGRAACDAALRLVLGVRGLMDLVLGEGSEGFDAIILAAKASMQAADPEWEAALVSSEQAWQALSAVAGEAAAPDEDEPDSPIARSIFTNQGFCEPPPSERARTPPAPGPSTGAKPFTAPQAAARKTAGPRAFGNAVRRAPSGPGEHSPHGGSVTPVSSLRSQGRKPSSASGQAPAPSKEKPRALAFAGEFIVGPAAPAKPGGAGQAGPGPLQSPEGPAQR
ncbi:unnamed protein product [Prorocentrum cordatum]|uniref:SH3 domain-containing protein n=1 Tax=Prorocentrum cordatum TaxID=2364126 RepID=A0ABN9USV4_9DINO|nr:unnamed protein product [Polarella glacialis]